MEVRNKKAWFKDLDGAKVKKYFDEHKELVKAEVCRQAGVNKSTIADMIRRNEARIVNVNAVCDVLGIPRDYFDAPEVKEPEPVKAPEPETEKQECLVDLADIQLSVNKVEGLLLKVVALLEENNALLEENNRLLRGKIEKGERSNDTKGFTNSGAAHSYTVSAVRALR